MKNRMLVLAVSAVLTGCNQQATENQAAPNATVNAAAEKKHPTYCFFKDAETKGWTASRDGQGNVVVKGKAYRSDPRYMAKFTDQEVTSTKATLWLAIAQNSTGYAAPENWWDVMMTLPNSSAVTAVAVQCGKKTLAELTVPK